MTPTPQEQPSPVETQKRSPGVGASAAPAEDGERVVISGMAGLYPQAHSVQELSHILYNKINPITQDSLRYNCSHPEVGQYAGSVPDIDLFDAQFFKINYKLASITDSMSRKILEQSYQAIYDAGISPSELSGRKVGVYIGTCFTEFEKSVFYTNRDDNGLGIAGGNKAMFANRISYWLNAKGPSMSIDEACCSSGAALEQAYLAMHRGDCEAAIVGAAYLGLHPQTSVHLGRVLKLCKDGKTKAFAENADGCAKSEAVNVLFLQKAKDARRIYADLLHVKNEYIGVLRDEIGPKYGMCRDPTATAKFMKNFYDEARVSPCHVEYVEACGVGDFDADKSELDAIEMVFCKDREDQLLVGSVKSNIGYCESASDIAAITKVLLGYHHGHLAANLHCEEPRQDVAAIREGRMRVLTEHQHFRRAYAAVNNMCITGVNSHILLHGHYKPKNISLYKTSLPHLLAISGRQESSLQHIFNDLKSRPIDPEELALLRNIHQSSITGHMGRGYIILQSNDNHETVSLCERSDYFDDVRRPLWFVYSGMGSQWPAMGSQLMRIPVFAAAIERCHRVLESKGIDLIYIITMSDEYIFKNILHSFVGITAIQIGLTDVLCELGLKPDGIIGHSVGELGCAYADGCLTAEETILVAYWRGHVSLNTSFINGLMAAVGLGYERCSRLCPEDIDVACHNGPESCTISGPADSTRRFLRELTEKGIFAKEVQSSNIAYHSRYIADAGPKFLRYLKDVIINPKLRSERWVSTSIPEDRWDEPLAKFCSAEYHINNMLKPVLFEETSRLIPNNAVLVEVAPHGLLQAILKRSLSPGCVNIPLTKRKHPDNAFVLLEAIGKIYMEGYYPKIQALYPKVDFPVSTGTPHLSHLIKWSQVEKWFVPIYNSAARKPIAVCNFAISVHDQENTYLRGNVINGQTLYPFSAALVAAWDTLAMVLGAGKKQMSVEFSTVHLYAQPPLHDQRQLHLSVAFHRGSGYFEILEEDSKVATGFLVPKITNDMKQKSCKTDEESDVMRLSAEDIYCLLEERDYRYSEEFRSISSARLSLREAELWWRDNWVTLLDGMLQLNALRQPRRALSAPAHIRRIYIDVKEHAMNRIVDGEVLLKAEVSEKYNFTRCGGILMKGIRFNNLPQIKDNEMKLQILHVDFKGQPNTVGTLEEPSMHKVFSDLITLQSSRNGDVNSLHWVERSEPATSGISVLVHYAGISTLDVKKAFGESLNDCTNSYGMEFSGTTKSGSRVMGIVPEGACSSQVRAVPELLWPVPPHWSLQDAATVPLAYAHAFYCLAIKGHLSPGMRILVHGGAGALGQAVISIAIAYKCQIFATVSDQRKKQFLRKLFPQLKAENIGNSRDHSFADQVLCATKGDGCNIIISTVKECLKNMTNNCLGYLGHLIDVSQFIHRENYEYGMYSLRKDRSYIFSDFGSLFSNNLKNDLKKIQVMLSDGIALGYVRPLSRVTYAARDAARAVRLLAASRQRGRVLLHVQGAAVAALAEHRFVCRPENCHLLICDDLKLAIKLAERLLSRGVQKLHLHFTIHSEQLVEFKVRLWQKLGAKVSTSYGKITETSVFNLVETALNLGPVEGIHVVVGPHGSNIDETVLSYLDQTSRKLCNNLKYFSVINVEGTVGKGTCCARHQSNLPATMLSLPSIEDLDAESWRRMAVDATERAVCSNQTLLRATPVQVEKLSLLQEIAKLTDVRIPDVIDKNATLQDVGTDANQYEILSNFLRVKHNISYSEEEIQSLTIERLLELEKKNKKVSYKNGLGLETFYTNVDTDELLATTELVILPTLVTPDSMRADEFDPKEPYLVIVPGLEGDHARFRVLCERLKLAALVLQPGLDCPHEAPRQLAHRYVKVLLENIIAKDQFYLLGYESGVTVAFEMATILEEQGLIGTVFCLGCMPNEVPAVLERELGEFTTEIDLQNAVARHLSTLLAGSAPEGLDEALRDATTWPDKVDACVRKLVGNMPHSAKFASACIEAAMARMAQARGYAAAPRALRSKLVHMRAAFMPPLETGLLQRFSEQPVALHQLRAPLAHATSDLRCAAIVNQYLDPTLIKLFENKNTCDSVLLNADSFMTSD